MEEEEEEEAGKEKEARSLRVSGSESGGSSRPSSWVRVKGGTVGMGKDRLLDPAWPEAIYRVSYKEPFYKGGQVSPLWLLPTI